MERPNTVTSEQQKLALLEWAGWTGITSDGIGIPPNSRGNADARHVPNLDSLDVIAEMEGKLSDVQQDEYSQWLAYRGDKRWVWDFATVTAKAQQRLEALVRALGLWKGGET